MPFPREIQDYINAGQITPEQAERLTSVAIDALMTDLVRLMLDFGKLTIEQVIRFTPTAFAALQNRVISRMLFEGRLTPEQLIGLSNVAAQALTDTGIQGLMNNRLLTVQDVLALNVFSHNALRDAGVVQLVIGRRLTAAHLATITQFSQSTALHSRIIRDLIVNEVITVEQVLQLTDPQRRAIENPEIRQRLLEGEITIADILADRVVLPPPAPEPPVEMQLNNAQSTHTASVHRSVSESATRLARRYPAVIDSERLEQTIALVKEFVDDLPNDSMKNEAAKRCIARITARDYTFTDKGSQLSTRQLLALAFTAIHDETTCIATLEDARNGFIQGLYEIQRGYNLSEDWVDNNADDTPICVGGTFNKIIERLASIHPDCEVLYVTETGAGMKLPDVVRDVLLEFLNEKSDLTPEFIEKLKAEGVELIWESIRQKVSNRMFEEFGSLYRDITDQRFVDLVDQGQFSDLPNIEALEARVRAAVPSLKNPNGLFSGAQQDDAAASSDKDPAYKAVP